MEKFLEKYEIASRPERIAEYYKAACSEYARLGDRIMQFERYPVFTYMKEDIKRIRDVLISDTDNVIYAYLLNFAIRADDMEAITALSSPKRSEQSEIYDTLPLFSLLHEIPKLLEYHRRRHVPEDITAATLEMFQNQIGDYILLNGRYGISTYVKWMLKFIKCKIIRIGRFNFEICKYNFAFDVFKNGNELRLMPNGEVFHKSGNVLGSIGCEDVEGSFTGEITETDSYYEGLTVDGGVVKNQTERLNKSEWQRVLTKGNTVVSVHIPTGGPLTPEVCDRDFARAEEVIGTSFVNFEAFYCSSWLLDVNLKKITGKEGNLTRFGERFTRFPVKSNGKGVFEYVFEVSPDTPLESLPEKNSFARSIKEHLLSGGHVHGAGGVIMRRGAPDIALIPRPMQLVIDDMGWMNSEDDRKGGGPSRTAMPRRHVAEDIRAINRLGEAIGQKINCAFVIGEWDPDNRLRLVPHLSKYGDNWDNASYLDRAEMSRFVEAINDSPYIDIALHGLLHGYYMEGTDNHDASDYCYFIDKKFYPVPEAEIRTRVEKFLEILDYYGINARVMSFVPPSFKYKLFGISKILSDYGIKYVSTIFRTMEKEEEMPEIACVEGEVITVDRNMNIYPWDACDCSYDDLPAIKGILGTHWPNFLHPDPKRNGEVIDRAIKYFRRSSEHYGVVIAPDMEFTAIQSIYCRFAEVRVDGAKMTIDITATSKTPAAYKPFRISAKCDPVSVFGAKIRKIEEKTGFSTYELVPCADIIEINFENGLGNA